MSRFGCAERLVSWAGVCPGQHESADKNESGRTRAGSKWLHTYLSQVAKAASRSKGTYMSAEYTQLRGRRGQARPPSPCNTPSSSPPTTCSTAASPTMIAAPTTSSAANHPLTTPASSYTNLYQRSLPDDGEADGSLLFRTRPSVRATPHTPKGPTQPAASEPRLTGHMAFAVT